jgi:predicted neuraminidase
LSRPSATAAPQYSGELIFPQEKWHNHSSSIVELPNGDLLVCWFHGSGERTADDVLIQGARWSKKTGKWSAPFVMADTPGFPETNPVLFLDNKQRLFFMWPLIVAHQWETALMKYRISTDYQQASGRRSGSIRTTSCSFRKTSRRRPRPSPPLRPRETDLARAMPSG